MLATRHTEAVVKHLVFQVLEVANGPDVNCRCR